MATPPTHRLTPDDGGPRAQPPIRWPRPDAPTLGLIAVWAVAFGVALLLPAAIVAPTAERAPIGPVLLALGTTVVGAAVMIAVAALLWRRTKESAVLLLGLVPGLSCVVGGIILAATKLGER